MPRAAAEPPAESAAALAFAGPPGGGSARDSGAWWLRTFGTVDPAEDGRARRAQEVFERVATAADKRGNRLPQLVVVGAPADPFAVALPDGSIVLTRGALDFCYGSRRGARAAVELGDLRLAFVLAHELAHLASDDFWHRSAFAAAQRVAAASPPLREAEKIARPGHRDLQRSELKADSDGAITMGMAGYSVGHLFATDRDFFARWVRQAGVGEAYDDDPTHPKPEERASFVRSQLAAVVDEIDFFDFGVRLAQLGRYDDAIVLLERFRDTFAGREVLGNLGYAHYQLATRLLAVCDGAPLVRFRLPVAIDDETLADRARLRGGHSTCLESEPVRKRLGEARRYLELALDKDPRYLPARRNLLALEIVSGKAAAAIALAEDTLEVAPGDAATLTAKGVGLYLFGVDSRLETVDTALEVLKEAVAADPRRAADAVFNQAVVLSERGRTGTAPSAWKSFLALEPHGAHADLARERLGLPAVTALAPVPVPPSPIRLGIVGPATRTRLEALQRTDFVIGALRGAFYRGDHVRALQLGNAVELVEQEIDAPAPKPARDQAPPTRVETPRGVLLRYPGHALDVRGDRVRALLFFVPAR
jgi:tetratricopeptide (TPR) repeat protein